MTQALDEGICSYRGRSWIRFGFLTAKKSADAIVVTGNEPRIETVEDSQGDEGPNVKMFQILPGGILPAWH